MINFFNNIFYERTKQMKINKKKLVCGMIDANINNSDLSKATGISISRISNIKNGANTTFEMAQKISEVLDVPVMELIESDSKEKEAKRHDKK
jgi:DNA-binding Xre family transcriptional regulator